MSWALVLVPCFVVVLLVFLELVVSVLVSLTLMTVVFVVPGCLTVIVLGRIRGSVVPVDACYLDHRCVASLLLGVVTPPVSRD